MRPYSVDLRARVVHTVQSGEYSQREVAELFDISHSTVEAYLKQWRETGSLEAKTGSGRPPGIAGEDADRLRELARAQPDATLAEYRQRLGIECSLTTVWRALRRLGLSRKKSRSTPSPATGKTS